MVCTILYGIWFWRNKRVWEDKTVAPSIAMNESFRVVREWREARAKKGDDSTVPGNIAEVGRRKWEAPEEGTLKINVDASLSPEADSFSVGMVLRDHNGTFIEGKVMAFLGPASVVEAESIGVREALSWIMNRGDRRVVVESDSLLTVAAIHGRRENALEVGHVIEQCKLLLGLLPEVNVTHVRKQANRVAHGIARLPCLANCFDVITSLPTHLVEASMFDISK